MFYGIMKGVEYLVAVGLNYITLLLYCFEEVLARFLLHVLEKQGFFSYYWGKKLEKVVCPNIEE